MREWQRDCLDAIESSPWDACNPLRKTVVKALHLIKAGIMSADHKRCWREDDEVGDGSKESRSFSSALEREPSSELPRERQIFYSPRRQIIFGVDGVGPVSTPRMFKTATKKEQT